MHLSAKDLSILKAARVVALIFPSHLSHLLQPRYEDPFLKVKAHAYRTTRTMLETVPAGSHFILKHLMMVMADAYLHGLSSVHVINGFQNTGAWPVDPKKVEVVRLLTGRGATNAARREDLRWLRIRLGPEARREMNEPVLSFVSVSIRGRTVVATSDGVLKAINNLDAVKEAARKAKEAMQARTVNARLAHAAQVLADERDADQRRWNPAFRCRKDAWRRAVHRQMHRLQSVGEYSPVGESVVLHAPAQKRSRPS